jgi:hypothetical protein
MRLLMIRCPNTRESLFTCTHVDAVAFNSMPVFFGRTYCSTAKPPTCGLLKTLGSASVSVRLLVAGER